MTAVELLWAWAREGWRYRKIGNRPRAEQDWFAERVRYEMGIIVEKDFCDFFCATSEAIRWAKDEGIIVGPGRGSAAASVVCFLTRITEIDPYKYQGMIFERFLDINRTDPPDIDIDVEDERRHEVREHLEKKYGPECVGSIANFVRYRGKNALVDVARVHDVPKAAKEIVSNLVIERSGGDSRFDASLEDTVNMFPNAKAIFDAFPELWLATRLEGNVRGMSVHAAGLVVANSPLTDICAFYERDGRKVLSIDKYDVDYIGALKLDFLGLTTLGMIARCLKLTGLTLEDLYEIPDDDPDTLRIFQLNDVIGVFQWEGRATRIVNRDVSPDNFSHIYAINALSRPGPLFSGTTGDYCEVKHGRKKPERYHPIVDEVTRDTYGQIIFQETILLILQRIGGFDWTDLNAIRNIIAKKAGQAALHANMANFQAGAERLHGIKPQDSERIWKRLVTSGTYAFNIAHAVSYSILAWWCAYLKAHYPSEFYAASLYKAEPGKDQEFKLMRDAINHGVPILPPDLKHSEARWSILPGKRGVLAGFTSIPGIANKTAAAILSARDEQEFRTWDDMTRAKGIGPKTVEAVKQFCSASDPFGMQVAQKTIDRVLKAIKDGEIKAPRPTHNGEQVSEIKAAAGSLGWSNRNKGPQLTYIGIVKNRAYQDIVENIHSRTGEDLDEIVKNLKDPDLRKYCALQCYDAGLEEVYGRINRYVFPRFRGRLESVEVGIDVVIIVGRKSPGFGNSIAVDELYVIDPD